MSHLTNAVAAYHAKQYSEAVRLASDGLKLNAHDFHLLHLRANCLTLLKQDSKALIDLKVLMNVYSSDARAYLKAVRCLKKDYSQALKILQDAKDNVDRNDSKYTEFLYKERELKTLSVMSENKCVRTKNDQRCVSKADVMLPI